MKVARRKDEGTLELLGDLEKHESLQQWLKSHEDLAGEGRFCTLEIGTEVQAQIVTRTEYQVTKP